MNTMLSLRTILGAAACATAFSFAPAALADDVAAERSWLSERYLAEAPETVPVRSNPVTLCGGAGPAAPMVPPADPCCSPCTRVHLTLGAWIWGLDGDIEMEGREMEVESDWTNTLENLDKIEFAMNARVRVETGRWTFTAGVDGARVTDSAEFTEFGVEVDGEFSLWAVHGQVGYRFAGSTLGCGPCAPVLCPEVYVGARGYFIHSELDVSVTAGSDVDDTQSWVDPIVGGRLEFRFGSHWFAILEADIGGFGVGSDFAWYGMAAVGYRFSNWFALSTGWKALHADYEDGSFAWDVRMDGPFVALTFSF